MKNNKWFVQKKKKRKEDHIYQKLPKGYKKKEWFF